MGGWGVTLGTPSPFEKSMGRRGPLLNFKRQCYFQYDTTKNLSNFRVYSHIHNDTMINDQCF